MADLASHSTYNASYSGLTSTLWIALGAGGICLLGHETLWRIRRRRGWELPHEKRGVGKGRKRWWDWRGRKRMREEVGEMLELQEKAVVTVAMETHLDGRIKESKVDKSLRAGTATTMTDLDRVTPPFSSLPPTRPVSSDNDVRTQQRSITKKSHQNPERIWEETDLVTKRLTIDSTLGSRESWEFGYLYQNRCWNRNHPMHPLSWVPFRWVWTVITYPEDQLPSVVGLDCTAHARFLRGTLWWMFLQLCTTLVVLLPLHLVYSAPDLASTSMLKAGLWVTNDETISGGQGATKWLWVHVVMLYWVVITWIANLLWVIWGVLGYRRKQMQEHLMEIRNKIAQQKEHQEEQEEKNSTGSSPTPTNDQKSSQSPVSPHTALHDQIDEGDQDPDMEQIQVGLARATPPSPSTSHNPTPAAELLTRPGFEKYRTIMVTNIPPFMRDEVILKQFYSTHLRGFAMGWKAELPMFFRRHVMNRKDRSRKKHTIKLHRGSEDGSRKDIIPPDGDQFRRSSDDDVNDRSADDFIEEVILVRRSNELETLRRQHANVIKQLETAHLRLAARVTHAIYRYNQAMHRDSKKKYQDVDKDKLAEALREFIPRDGSSTPVTHIQDEHLPSIWRALLDLPRELLDPYQAVYRKRKSKLSVRRLQAPLIDYLAAKEKILAEKMEAAISEPFETLQPASSAFVVFTEARFARRVLRELPSHPDHALGCQTQPAPDYTDLIWPRLVRAVYRADVFKNFFIGVLVFFLILFWIFPVTAVIGIASVNTLSAIFPPLADFLENNDSASALLDSSVPVLLVAGLSLCVCPMLLAIGNKLQTLPTGYEVHNFVLFRYWVFQIINVLIFFCVGRAAVQSYVLIYKLHASSVLKSVATSFSSAAPYYVSYLLLQTVIQAFFELFRLGLPLLFWLFSTRKAVLPRVRAFRLENSTVSWFFQVPNHCFAITIIFTFMIYNPLVIPFGFIFFLFALLYYKYQYLWTYGRRYENEGRRNCIRYLRLTLDGLTLTEFTFLAFYILVKNKTLGILTALAMLLTILTKLGLTRVVKAKFDQITWEEAQTMDTIRMRQSSIPPRIEDDVPDNKFTRPFYRFSFWISSPLDRYLNFQPSTNLTWLRDLPRKSEAPSDDLTMARHSYDPLWEDIPPPNRMQSYRHQPLYHRKIERFLWLPRDPRCNLDLEDTVDLREYLTTSRAAVADEKHLNRAPMNRHQSNVGSAVQDFEDEDVMTDAAPARWLQSMTRPFRHRKRHSAPQSVAGNDSIDVERSSAANLEEHVTQDVLEEIRADLDEELRRTKSQESTEVRRENERTADKRK